MRLGVGVGLDARAGRAAGGTPVLAGYYAFYRFDSSLADSTGHGRTLTSADAAYVTGLIGQAMTGTAAKADWVTGVNWSSSSWSVSVWFKDPGSGDGNGGVLTITRGTEVLRLAATANGGAGGVMATLAVTGEATAAVAPGWNHLAVTYNGTAATAYVNGVSAGTLTATVPATTGAAVFSVSSDGDFQTPVDLVGAWTRALTAGEVAALYNAGVGFDPTNV